MNNWSFDWQANCDAFKKRCFIEREKFLKALTASRATEEQVFQDILLQSRPTKFGKYYQLNSVKTIHDFKKRIPVRSYDQFIPWLDEEVEKKGGVLTNDVIVRWLKTSGSTGNSKKIPYTEHWMKQYRVPALGVLFANYLHYCDAMLAHPFATLDTQTIREPTTDFLNGIPYQGISNRNPLVNEFDWQPPWYDAPWFTPDVPTNYDERMYYRLRYLVGNDIKTILAINPSTVVALKYHLTKNFPTLIKEIANGTVRGKSIQDPRPLLAKQLEKVAGNPDFSLKEVWPGLSLVVCWTAASASLYLPQLERLLPGVKILPFMTCGTEGVATLPIDDYLTTGPLAITQGFYEFVPAEIDIEALINKGELFDTLSFHELELGHEYHLIMSQANGICRLSVGDIYKVVDYYLDVPRIEFTRRQGTFYSFTGEKITETQILMAMEAAYKKHRLDNQLFICAPIWGEPPYYKLLVEVNPQLHPAHFRKTFADEVDHLLCQINEEYQSKRKSQRLDKLKIEFVPVGTIDNYHESKKNTTNATQFKYKPFQLNDMVFSEILSGVTVIR